MQKKISSFSISHKDLWHRVDTWLLWGLSAILLLSLANWVISPINTGDVYMYLAMFRKLVEGPFFIDADPFLFLSQKAPFHIHHEWLTYFFYGAANAVFGLRGVILAVVFLMLLIFVWLLWLGHKLRSHTLVSPLILLLCMVAMAPRLGPRAYLFSDFFLSITLGLLLIFDRSRQMKWLLFLPIVFLLWVQLHPGFPLGFATILIFGICRAPFYTKKENLTLLSIALVCVVFAMLNPLGPRGFAYPFQKFFDPEWNIYREINSEWLRTIDSKQISLISMISLAILAFVSLINSIQRLLKPQKIDLFPLILTLTFSFLAWQSFRFTITAAIVFACLLIALPIMTPIGAISARISARMHAIIIIPSMVAVFIFMTSVWIFPQKNSGWQTLFHGEPEIYGPAKAFRRLADLPPGTVFAEWDWNSVICWLLGDRFKVVVHGHVDSPTFAVQNFKKITNSTADFDRIVSENHVQYFLLSPETIRDPTSVLTNRLFSSQWRLIYRDDTAFLFGKN